MYTDTQDGILGTNMYAYCQNDPVNRIDPSGMASYAESVIKLHTGLNVMQILSKIISLTQTFADMFDVYDSATFLNSYMIHVIDYGKGFFHGATSFEYGEHTYFLEFVTGKARQVADYGGNMMARNSESSRKSARQKALGDLAISVLTEINGLASVLDYSASLANVVVPSGDLGAYIWNTAQLFVGTDQGNQIITFPIRLWRVKTSSASRRPLGALPDNFWMRSLWRWDS